MTMHPTQPTVLAMLFVLATCPVQAKADATCDRTADLQLESCRTGVDADHLLARAICINLEDDEERRECLAEAREERREARSDCREIYFARRDLCDLLGGEAYDPDWDADDFDDDFDDLTNPNAWYPLDIGNVKVLEGGGEVVTIEVLDKTKLIDDVTCIVVNDVVVVDGQLVEDTDDWFAQALNGDVHYCGESVQDFESFEGDEPAEPELTEIDGSFKVGRDGDKGGVLFHGSPEVGLSFRQEWSASNAEDAATILSTDWSYGDDEDLDELVPEALAELLCDGDCIVTREFSPMSPGEFEHKYYAPGIGLFLETKPEDGEIVQLTGCNFDPVCASLPAP